MSVKLPPLEPTRMQSVSLWLRRWQAPIGMAAAAAGVFGIPVGFVMLLPAPDGWAHSWWGVLILGVLAGFGLVLAWVRWGPYRVTFPGNTYHSRTPGYWVKECRDAWMSIPSADRAELLPVMRAVYGLGLLETREAVRLIEDRYEVIVEYAAAARERENLMNQPWLTAGSQDMEEATAKVRLLVEQNKAQRDAQDMARQAYEDLTNPGSADTA